MKKLLNKKGFTLIELIVVIAILAILAMILIPSLTGYIAKATEAKDAANARSLYSKTQLDLAIGKSITSPVTATGISCAFTTTTADLTTIVTFVCTAPVTGGKTYSLPTFVATP